MPSIDFIISNPKHHLDTMLPVARLLQGEQHQCRIVSLCEFRGFASPDEQAKEAGIPVQRVIPRSFRSPSTGSGGGVASDSKVRQVVRLLSWYLLLQKPLQRIWATPPDLVVLANDAAFPYDRICNMLKSRRIPFMLVQEGIRFPLAGVDDEDAYGRGGGQAVAAWGEQSAKYFRERGVPAKRIYKTGTPRFEGVLSTDWAGEAERIRQQYDIGPKNLLLLSNPIDDLGFCTHREKLDLVQRFLIEIASLFEDPDFHVTIKLHPRESIEAFEAVVCQLKYEAHITILREASLYALFKLSQAAIVFASTVGLEALLAGVSLGVLELPKIGFAFDYVASGAAAGLTWKRTMEEQVRALLEHGQDEQAVDAFLKYNFESLNNATQHLADLIACQVA